MVLRWHPEAGDVDTVVLSALQDAQPPAWSRDGRQMAFFARPVGEQSQQQAELGLYVADPDGSDIRQVAFFAGLYATSIPSWSPDMSEIGVSVGALADSTGLGRILVVNANDGERREIGTGYEASWSPNARWIAYIGSPALDSATEAPSDVANRSLVRRSALWITDPAGEHGRVLFPGVDTVGDSASPTWSRYLAGPVVWSPDAERIAFARSLQDGTSPWTIRIDGTDLKRVTPAR